MNKAKFIQIIERSLAMWTEDFKDKSVAELTQFQTDKENIYELLEFSLQSDLTNEQGVKLIIKAFDFIRVVGAEHEWDAFLEKALSVVNEPDQKVEIFRQLASSQRLLGNTKIAIDFYRKALALSLMSEGNTKEAIIRIGLGQALFVQGQVQAGVEHIQAGLDLARATKNSFAVASALAMYSDVHFFEKNYQAAYDCMIQSAAIWLELQDTVNYVVSIIEAAQLCLKLEDVEQMQQLLVTLKQDIAIDELQPRLKQEFNLAWASYLRVSGDIAGAKAELNEILKTWNDALFRSFTKAFTYVELAQCEAAGGNTKLAADLVAQALQIIPASQWQAHRADWTTLYEDFAREAA